MECIVTAGPSYEPLDQVRRLTNFSTGRLGTQLAAFLAERGHRVTLLLGEQSNLSPLLPNVEVVPFTTAADLEQKLAAVTKSKRRVEAVFHTAAVSDFACKTVYRRGNEGELVALEDGKISTRHGCLLAELVPTPKIIRKLRDLFPDGWLIGWKYEVDGDRASSLEAGRKQLEECSTSVCVVNGPAYGEGFGLVSTAEQALHLENGPELFTELARLIQK